MNDAPGLFGRRRRGPAAEPEGHGPDAVDPPAPARPAPTSGVSVGGANYGTIQHVTGHHVSRVSQSATTGDITAADVEDVRELLSRFRAELDLHRAQLPMAETLRAMTSVVDANLDDPTARNEGPLRSVAQALPALVAGTAVQEGGQALATALGNLLG
ncbi:hypothetical protein ACH4D4_15250 [Streptomyces pristinaespiralis]|uniref:hypothetical protein n=1 Tax=Streptomyces pristinaespiralis TaxID=38300 RepID=UPI003788B9D1